LAGMGMSGSGHRVFLRALLVLLLFAGRSALAQQQPIIAVFDLDNRAGLSQHELALITEEIRHALVQSRQYRVIDKENMNKIFASLKESQKDCYEDRCRLRIGRLLAANKMLTGTLGRIGNTYRLYLKITDIERAGIEKDYRDKCELCTVDALPDLACYATYKLLGLEPPVEHPGASAKGGGSGTAAPPTPPAADPEFEKLVRQEQAKLEAQKRLEAERKAKIDADYNALRSIHDNPNYSDEAKKAAYKKFLEKWPDDTTHKAEVETWLKFAGVPEGFVLIPAGKFMMGCAPNDSSCDSDEKPYHEVYLDAYYIQKHEVTVAEYRECVSAGACTKPNTGSYCNWGKSGRDDHPINCVDWHQAKAYCGWIGGRLPTEAEWEKAARGTDGWKYPWGDATATCEYAVMYRGGTGCGKDRTWPVCSKPRGNSPYGLCDTAGNVWEWVSDWYGENYYSSSPRSNPKGSSSGEYRVLRGGGWLGFPRYLRASNRYWDSPSGRGDFVGFRCALGNR